MQPCQFACLARARNLCSDAISAKVMLQQFLALHLKCCISLGTCCVILYADLSNLLYSVYRVHAVQVL